MKLVVAAAMVVLLAAACDGGSAPTGQSSGGPPASTSGSGSTPTPGHLGGKLPVELVEMSAQAAGGFLDLASGEFTSDPQAAMVLSGAWGALKTTVAPYLFGRSSGLYAQITYDAVVSRWLPVAKAQVAADGLSYAYVEWAEPPSTPCPNGCIPQPTGGRIHVTDLPSGHDRVVFSFSGDPVFEVVSFLGGDVYLDAHCGDGGSDCDGLWRFDLASGSLTRVTDQAGSWWLVDGGYVWMVTAGNGDIAPVYLDRIDLATSSSQTWFTVPALSPTDPYTPSLLLLGLDGAGKPWVALNSRNPEPLLRVTGPGQASQILSADGPYSASISDHNGTWFAVVDNAVPTPTMLGLYLYTSTQGVQQVSKVHVIPV